MPLNPMSHLDADDPVALATTTAIREGDVVRLQRLLRDNSGLATVRIDGARTLLKSIGTENLVELHDRAIVAILIYTASRAGAGSPATGRLRPSCSLCVLCASVVNVFLTAGR